MDGFHARERREVRQSHSKRGSLRTYLAKTAEIVIERRCGARNGVEESTVDAGDSGRILWTGEDLGVLDQLGRALRPVLCPASRMYLGHGVSNPVNVTAYKTAADLVREANVREAISVCAWQSPTSCSGPPS